jgi:glycosyltransferase involved in cell wall biosynthesis
MHKGLTTLIEAIRGLPGVALTIVGEGSCRAEFTRQAEGCPVFFAGFQVNTERWYQDADIFVLPSFGPEGLPLVCLEAMSHGLPCILSRLPVHKEITDDGATALLFDAGNSGDLREKIRILLTDPEIRGNYGALGRAMVSSRYGPGRARTQYVEAFGLCAESEDAHAESTRKAA